MTIPAVQRVMVMPAQGAAPELEVRPATHLINYRTHISHVFDWTEFGEAVRVLQAGEHVGRIALAIR